MLQPPIAHTWCPQEYLLRHQKDVRINLPRHSRHFQRCYSFEICRCADVWDIAHANTLYMLMLLLVKILSMCMPLPAELLYFDCNALISSRNTVHVCAHTYIVCIITMLLRATVTYMWVLAVLSRFVLALSCLRTSVCACLCVSDIHTLP